MIKIAGKPHSPIALIQHRGRHSGKFYETPVMVSWVKDEVYFALTYGPKVDWYQNVLAAGRGTLCWHGKEFSIEDPQSVDVKTGLAAFSQPPRTILHMLKIQHFFRMTANEIRTSSD